MRRGRTRVSSITKFLMADEEVAILKALDELVFGEYILEEAKKYVRSIEIVQFPKGQVAGFAGIARKQIELHAALFKPGRELDLRGTFMHEVAHMIDHFLFKGNGHGRSWKKVMRALGREPERCHAYNYLNEDYPEWVRRARARPCVYHCDSCDFVYRRTRPIKPGRFYTHTAGAREEFSNKNDEGKKRKGPAGPFLLLNRLDGN